MGKSRSKRKPPPQNNPFNSAVRDINKLVLPHLEKGTREHVSEQRILALGGKPSKRKHLPLPELQKLRKMEREAAAARVQREKELGVSLGQGRLSHGEAERRRRQTIAKKKRLRAVNEAASLSSNIGRERGCILRLNKSFVAANAKA